MTHTTTTTTTTTVRPHHIAAPEAPAGVHLAGVDKRFGSATVLAGLDLRVPAGALLVLVGPSGCGKSTTLRLVAGLERPDAGRVWIDDCDVTTRPARDRKVAMVFQSFALYPHMTVSDNVGFALRLAARRRGPRAGKAARSDIRDRVQAALTMLEIGELADRRPHQLSGGQQQRVALARSVVRQPRVLLMDEPLSNLDARLRLRTRTDLVRLHRQLDATIVHVTHDQEEAMSMATHVAVMNAGRIEQLGSPEDVYRRPATTFVAGFIGNPPMNLIDARDAYRLPDGFHPRAVVGWRPADGTLTDDATGPSSGLLIDGRVDTVELRGDDVQVTIATSAGPLRLLQSARRPRPAPGPARIHVPAAHLHRFDPATGHRRPAPRV